MAKLIRTSELRDLSDAELTEKLDGLRAHYRRISEGKRGRTSAMADASANYGTVLVAMLNRGMELEEEMWRL